MFTIIPAYSCEISYRTDTFANLVKVSQLTMKYGNKQLMVRSFRYNERTQYTSS